MRLESYSITGISPCITQNEHGGVSFRVLDLCEFLCLLHMYTCVRVRSNLKFNNLTFY